MGPFQGFEKSTGQDCRLEDAQRNPSQKGNQVNKGIVVDECQMSLDPLGDGYWHEKTEVIRHEALLWFNSSQFPNEWYPC